MEIFQGYNSFIGTSDKIKTFCNDEKLCFKLGLNVYEEFSVRFLKELFKVLKIKININLFEKMDKEIVSNLINESLFYSRNITFFCITVSNKLDRILINPTFLTGSKKIPQPIKEEILKYREAKLLFEINYLDGKLILIDIGSYEDTKYKKILGYFLRDFYNPFFQEKNSIYMINLIAEVNEDSLIFLPNNEKSKPYVLKHGFDNIAKIFSKKILNNSCKIFSVFSLLKKCPFYNKNDLINL